MEEIRLQKYLSDNGICSRRRAEQYILQGFVKVNDQIVDTLGTKINPQIDKIYFKGQIVQPKDKKIYIILNKPIGYVTTTQDQFNRDTVLDLIKINERIVPVGRLDMYTSGALLLSNDGDFVQKLTHPKYEKEKTYNVTLKGIITNDQVETLKNGVNIENYTTCKAKVKILKIDKEKNISRIEIIIHEGKNREIRKMCEAIGKKILALHRSKIGGIGVKDLELGKWRYLTKEEIKKLIH